tara:strand:+ start:1182 stop:1388 length:207 start_codon:yes stop_codon:yes gene_type:complete
MREDSIGIGMMVAGAVIVGAIWFNWVQERDKFLYSVMDCMQDASQEEYDVCADQVRSERKREVANAGW